MRRALVIGILALATGALWFVPFGRGAYVPPPLSFQGSSEELKATQVVPTLDTPSAAGRNVVWCVSFQMAWNELGKVLKAPVVVGGAEEMSGRLNAAPAPAPPTDHYANAGFVGEGIREKIAADMQKLFAKPVSLTPVADPNAIIAYAYLKATLDFPIHYFEANALTFTASDGRQTRHSAFTNEPRWGPDDHELKNQVEILYAADDGFIVDPCKSSKPDQIILACIKPGETLAETVASVESRIRDSKPEALWEELVVPNLNWELDHDFKELLGKRIKDCDLPDPTIITARQSIAFRLDRSGAKVESEAEMAVGAAKEPRSFVFNRPFLILMKTRGAAQPYFALWVDNGELLAPAAE